MIDYIGKKLDGRYEILELIGVGGMANVYRARDLKADRIVAVTYMLLSVLGCLAGVAAGMWAASRW